MGRISSIHDDPPERIPIPSDQGAGVLPEASFLVKGLRSSVHQPVLEDSRPRLQDDFTPFEAGINPLCVCFHDFSLPKPAERSDSISPGGKRRLCGRNGKTSRNFNGDRQAEEIPGDGDKGSRKTVILQEEGGFILAGEIVEAVQRDAQVCGLN